VKLIVNFGINFHFTRLHLIQAASHKFELN
jgi:hypothetical protein